MQAILLAAGFGTRLRPYTNIKPKPLFPILNRPLLHILLEKLFEHGCSKVVVNCHHLAEQVENAVKDIRGVGVQYEPVILGTGGSLRQALPTLDDQPVLVMNGDIYHDIDICALYAHHQETSRGVTMALHDYPRFNSVRVGGHSVLGFGPEPGGDMRAFTGVHVVDPEVIEMIPAEGFFHIIDLYERLARNRQIGAYGVDGCVWKDIGTPRDYLALHGSLLSRGKKNSWLVDDTARVEEGVLLEGWGVIGPGAVIKRGTRIARSVVWDKAVVAGGQVVCDAIITGLEAGEESGTGEDD